MIKNNLPISCIECKKSDCFGYCKILKSRKDDYALNRQKYCPLEEKYEKKNLSSE